MGAFEREREVDLVRTQKGASRATEQHCLEISCAGELEQRAQRGAEWDFVDARPFYRATQAEESRARRLLGARASECGAAFEENRNHVCQRLDVVHDRRLAEQSDKHGEGWFPPRLAALPFDALEQGGFLATDVRAGAAPQLNVEAVAEEAGLAALAHGILDARERQRIP